MYNVKTVSVKQFPQLFPKTYAYNKEEREMSKKLNKYRIKERLVHAFVIATGIPAAVAVAALATLIVVAIVYAGALRDYGFAQGDVGKTMAYFAEARSALRGAIGFDDEAFIANMITVHDENVEKFSQSFADLESVMVSDANKQIYRSISNNLIAYWALLLMRNVPKKHRAEPLQSLSPCLKKSITIWNPLWILKLSGETVFPTL